jgi:teichuronic acid biosynthesis glycosyltransferase TuaC
MLACRATRQPPLSQTLSLSSLVTVERREPGADVLVLTNCWPHPGEPKYGIFVRRQVDSLAARGFRCDVMFIQGYRSPLAYAVAAARLFALNFTRRPRYRVVHAHVGESMLPAVFYLRGARVVTFHGDDIMGTPLEDATITRGSKVRRAVYRQLSRLMSATMTVSPQMDRELPPASRRTNRVVPCGVNGEVFRPMERAQARRELGWDEDGAVALFGADPAVPRKRYWLAEAACEEARRRGLPITLRVAKDVAPDEMPVVMNAADCLLLTSAIEGSPMVVKEALMCNLPVVATDAGDVREVLEGTAHSKVVEATPEALAEALLECVVAGRRSDGRERAAWVDEARVAAYIEELIGAVRGGESLPEPLRRPA